MTQAVDCRKKKRSFLYDFRSLEMRRNFTGRLTIVLFSKLSQVNNCGACHTSLLTPKIYSRMFEALRNATGTVTIIVTHEYDPLTVNLVNTKLVTYKFFVCLSTPRYAYW